MSLLSAFRTPLWEQRDPERRAVAVRDETAPELLVKLPENAQKDPDVVVRKAARIGSSYTPPARCRRRPLRLRGGS